MAAMPAEEHADLHGRRALVTGASHGLGRAIAQALSRAGADLVVQFSAAFDDAEPETAGIGPRLGEALSRAGGRAEAIDADLAAPGSGAALGRRALEGGAVDILVLNASAQTNRRLAEIDEAALSREHRMNMAEPLGLLAALVPPMAARGWGRVLNIGSVQIARPDPGSLTYAGYKAAMACMMRALAVEHARAGVTFNTLAPGLIATGRSAEARRAEPDWESRRAGRTPVGRVSRPEDHAGAALLLCSPAGAFITGETLHTAGGGQMAYLDAHLGGDRDPSRAPFRAP